MHGSRQETVLATARITIESDTVDPSSLRRAAWQLFDAARFDLAQRGFERLIASGHFDRDVVTALHQIYSDRREYGNVALLIERYLRDAGPNLSPDQRLAWCAARFDALSTLGSPPDLIPAALDLLETAAGAGPRGWAVVLDQERWAALDVVLGHPTSALSALEQFLYAPSDTGLPAQALALIEAFGCRHAADRGLARAAERLLHAFGAPDAAYRVETCRRAAAPSAAPEPPVDTLDGLPQARAQTVTIAGGHPALRSLARRDLRAIGVTDVREIPPAWEATRHRRAVEATLSGSDLVVVIASQIAHSTFDQIRAAAARLDVAVVTTQSASVAAIRRVVDRAASDEDRG
ncbi:MAG TPA: hypothetical protein VH482_08070 [Thermomicrobiales bacterium]|jgi:hypothetical protein